MSQITKIKGYTVQGSGKKISKGYRLWKENKPGSITVFILQTGMD